MTRTSLSTSQGQLVADVLNSQHAGTGATWRINAKILSLSYCVAMRTACYCQILDLLPFVHQSDLTSIV